MDLPHARVPSPPQRGTIMLSVAVMVVVLGGLSAALLTEGLGERVAVQHQETSLLALEIAETGLVRAEMEIRGLVDSGEDGIGNVEGTFAGGTYRVQATRHPVNPDRWTLRAWGEKGLSVRRLEVGVRRRAMRYFVEGLFGREKVLFAGSATTDAYDSRLGTWDEQAVNVDGGGRYAVARGDVGSNMSVRLTGSGIYLRGNAIPGPLHEVDTSGAPKVYGDMLPRRVEVPLSDPPLSEFQAAYLDNDNDQLLPGQGGGLGLRRKSFYNPKTMSLRVTGQNQVVLRGGTYFFSEIALAGGAELVVRGPCRIYVTGDVSLAGGTVTNDSGRPSDLVILAHPYPLPPGHLPGSPTVTVGGGPRAAYAIYAPALDVKVFGNSDVFGSIVGGKVDVLGDAAFHYDQALESVAGGGQAMLERLYWRDLAPPRR